MRLHLMRDGQAATNNSICAEVARIRISDMHGTAATPAIAFFFAKKLSKHVFDFGTFTNAVAMSAMGRRDVIGFA
jgi:hypothetical protein